MDSLLNKFGISLFNKPVLEFANQAISFTNIIYASVILAVGYGIYIFGRVFVNIQIKRKKLRSAQGKILLQLFGYVVTVITISYAANALGYSLAYFLVGSTALLVGLGFGLQQLFLDLVSGLILLIDKNVNLGDVVVVDIQGSKESMTGKIFHIGLRATLLQTIDNQFNIIPNSKFLASGVRSLMRDKGSARFRINVHVDYAENMDKAKKVLMDSVLKDVRVDQEPVPTIIIRDFHDNGVLLEIRFWMKELFNSEIILSDMRFKILEEFNKQEISIPYPQRVMRNAKD